MTTNEMKRFREGGEYWWEYVALNGYSFKPNAAGLRKLSRNLDISVSHLRQCINFYLEA